MACFTLEVRLPKRPSHVNAFGCTEGKGKLAQLAGARLYGLSNPSAGRFSVRNASSANDNQYRVACSGSSRALGGLRMMEATTPCLAAFRSLAICWPMLAL